MTFSIPGVSKLVRRAPDPERLARRQGRAVFPQVSDLARSLGYHAERVEDPGDIARAIGRTQATSGPAVVEIMTACTLPGSAQHPTGWWDITVPDYFDKARASYEAKRGF